MKKVERLSIKELSELRDVVRISKSAIEIKRAQAIMLINTGADDLTIQTMTGFGKSFASALRKRYRKKGFEGIKERERKSKKLLTKTQLTEIQKAVRKTKPNDHGINADFWTTSGLAVFIKRKYNVVYKSKTSYHLIFKDAKFTYHKPEKKYHGRKQEVLEKWHKETVPLIQQELETSGQVVLVGDEMILTTQTTTQKVWLPQGESVHVEASNKREKRCIYGFLNVANGQEHAFKTNYTNSSTTCDILQKLLKIYPNQKIVIVWDNAPWHRSEAVRNFLIEHPGKFHLFSFPPYFPEENPQEHVWKDGRAKVTHNVFIDKIDDTTDQFVMYLNQSKFEYKFL
jgi:transposase